MKNILIIVLLLIAMAAQAANPRSIALTVQENGRAQVSETHDIPPPGPDGLIRIAPVPRTILPASVNAVPIERGETIEILSQRFAYDLRDPSALFRAYFGRAVSARKGGDTLAGRLAGVPDFAGEAPALILAAEGQPARLIPNLMDWDAVEFPARADLARVPTLVWQLTAGSTVPAAVSLHYAADGLSWSASHEGILAADGRSMSLSTRIRLENQTDREFANARIRLALTDRGRFAPLVPEPGDARAARAPALRYSADGKSWVPERVTASSSIVTTYDLLHPVTLPAGGDVRASLAFVASMPVETRHIYDGVRFDRYQRNRRTDWNLGTEFSPAVETRLVFRNSPAGPMPPGEFRLLRGVGDRALEWIGSDWLPPLAPGEEVALNLGPAAGLSGRRLRTGYAEIVPFRTSEESFEITLDNQTGEDRTITVVEHMYRSDTFEITAASAEHRPGETPQSIRFEVPVKAGTQRSLTYTVRYSW